MTPGERVQDLDEALRGALGALAVEAHGQPQQQRADAVAVVGVRVGHGEAPERLTEGLGGLQRVDPVPAQRGLQERAQRLGGGLRALVVAARELIQRRLRAERRGALADRQKLAREEALAVHEEPQELQQGRPERGASGVAALDQARERLDEALRGVVAQQERGELSA